MSADAGGDFAAGTSKFLGDASRGLFLVERKLRIRVQVFVQFEEGGILLIDPRTNGFANGIGWLRESCPRQ